MIKLARWSKVLTSGPALSGKEEVMVRPPAALIGVPLMLVPLAAAGQPAPDAFSVEWQGQKLCEKLYEDAQITIARCTFPPAGSTCATTTRETSATC